MFFIGTVLLLTPLWNIFLPLFNVLFGDSAVDTFRFLRTGGFSMSALGIVLGSFVLKGLYTVQPNRAVVLLLFGDYQAHVPSLS